MCHRAHTDAHFPSSWGQGSDRAPKRGTSCSHTLLQHVAIDGHTTARLLPHSPLECMLDWHFQRVSCTCPCASSSQPEARLCRAPAAMTDSKPRQCGMFISIEWLGQTLASIFWIISVFEYGISETGDWLQLAAACSWLVANLAALATKISAK